MNKLICLKKTCYFAGPPVMNGSKQPKQYGYQLFIGRPKRWEKPLYWEWRGRVVMPWEQEYEVMKV